MEKDYREEIESWDWERIRNEAKGNCSFEDGQIVASFLLGSVFGLAPSGKYYTPWACSNVTKEEAEEDQRFYQTLHDHVEGLEGWVQAGEGDPCDLFVCWIEEGLSASLQFNCTEDFHAAMKHFNGIEKEER